MVRRYARDPQVDRSLRHSVRDGVAFSVMTGAGESYFNAFAVHLKATTSQIALLASLPPLIGSLTQLFSAWLARRCQDRRRVIMFGVRLQALTWIPLILLPLMFPGHAVPLFIACAVVYYAAGSLVVPQWSSLMGDLVPERKRGRYFGRRNRLMSATSFTALVGAGMVLHNFAESRLAYLGFAAIFTVAAAGRAVSVWNIARMHDPGEGKVAALEPVPDVAWWQRVRHSPFVRFSLFFAAMQFAVAIASPFFTVYMLRDLHYSYLQFMTNTAASVLMQFLALSAWGRMGDSHGNRLVLVVTGTLIPLLPLLWLFSTSYWYLVAAQAFGGLVWAGFSLAAGNYLYDLVPAHKRVTSLAYHNVLANAGIFCGALLGGVLGASLPERLSIGGTELPSPLLVVFFLSFLARGAVAALFLPRLREVRKNHHRRPMRFSRLVFRISRFYPLNGFGFDVLSRRRPRPVGPATPAAK